MPVQQIPNTDLGPDTARANLLTNGGFEVWQRGNGPFTTDTAYTADRWLTYRPAGTISVSKDTANADNSGACLAVVGTGASVGLPQQIYQYPAHSGDNNMAAQLRGRTVSASVRIKTSVASGCRLLLQGGVVTPVNSTYHSGNGQYQTLTVSTDCPTNLTNLGFVISIEATGTYYLDNAMLVIGSVAADYAPLHPADDLARCQRYYEVIGGANFVYPSFYGYNGPGGNSIVPIGYKLAKPVTPTITKTGTWYVANCGQPAIVGLTLQGFNMQVTATALGSFSCNPSDATTTITIEANP